ncbi:hypothetical protein DL93DRAFT_2172546 [Clavulina sp. PMI_390]|nr:hypothetical protein DL93DRAFT_2172546 [Clavulina sp. PMI_390]
MSEIQEKGSPDAVTLNERDAVVPQSEHPVDVQGAKAEFEALRRTLSTASSLHRVATGQKSLEDANDEEDFDLKEYLRSTNESQTKAGIKSKHVGVTWKDVRVVGGGGLKIHVRRFPDAIFEFALSPIFLALKFMPAHFNPFMPKPKPLLEGFTGLAKPGEMVLVLGRPGSGCSTFLKTISGRRGEYLEVNGDVEYAGMNATDFLKLYKGEAAYNPEEDLHYATLTVGQTIRFALSTKTPGRRLPEQSKANFVSTVEDLLLRMLNITHTRDTLVGDEFVRGISGGERKRVSIAEMMATGACVVSYDNSTRGLDASTALDYAKSLRIMTDIFDMTTFVSIYQAGEGIYDQFDKVLVIDQGRQVYFGPAKEARQYFIDMGFRDFPRQTTADYLTGCTDPNERRFAFEGSESRESGGVNGAATPINNAVDAGALSKHAEAGEADEEKPKRRLFVPDENGLVDGVPATAEAMAAYYEKSAIAERMRAEIEEYNAKVRAENPADEFKQAVLDAKGSGSRKSSQYQVSFLAQVAAVARRHVQLKLQDRFSLFTSYGTAIGVAIITGTLFLNIPKTSAGAFTRGGALFISLLFNSFNAFAELPIQMMGRPILQKQVGYTLFRPAAFSLGTLAADMPFGALQILVFSMIIYLMCNFVRTAGHFFAFYATIIVTFWAMSAFFRLLGTVTADYNVAARLAAFLISLMVIYSGYLVPVFSMKRWLFWIYYINPVNYGFSALMMNEFRDLDLLCSGSSIVPSGSGYPTDVSANQVCTLAGAVAGQTYVKGSDYIEKAFQYDVSDQWRNFGILIVFFIGFQIMCMIAIEVTQGVVFPSIVIFERENAERKALNEKLMERKEAARRGELEQDIKGLVRTRKPFTWERLSYTVPVSGGQKKLLTDIYGYVLPGTLTALMGASGAGKTTLLDVLAMRKTIGVITGDILVAGKPVGIEFQRGTAYCEQLDVHETTATVREALRFSAYLRQPYDISIEEKDAYVEEIIELLELQDLADAMIGFVGFGLNVEARKRLTIGVELAAKPQLLLFLDEPTSGLDGQSAFNIVRFLRKLAAAGQAILCTIHQPNAMLFENFDRLLLLQRGGETVYFGDIGPNAKVLTDYFARNGAVCPEDVNPAEFMLEAIGNGSKRRMGPKDWAEVYLESPEFEENKRMIERIKKESMNITTDENVVETEYATPWMFQLRTVTLRTMRSFWRQADYGFTRLFSHGIIALWVALTYLQLGNSTEDLQYRVFVIFFASVLPAIIIAQVEPMFIMGRNTFIREASSKMYSQPIFAIGQLVAEMPYSVLCAVVYYLLYYFATGMQGASSRAGYAFFMILVAEVYSVTLGQAVASITPSIQVAAILNPFLLILFGLFCGVTITQPQMPKFWRSWMYQLDPFTRLISGLIVNEMHGLQVQCTSSEFSVFNPPSGQQCYDYAQSYISSVGGYINNPNATSACEYCAYASGDEFYKAINISFGNRWRDIGIFIGFVAFNIILTITASRFLRFAKR